MHGPTVHPLARGRSLTHPAPGFLPDRYPILPFQPDGKSMALGWDRYWFSLIILQPVDH